MRCLFACVLAAVLLAPPLSAASPAWAARAARAHSCPIAGDAAVIYRLAWVDRGRTMRAGAVVVDGNHLATEAANDRPAIAQAYQTLRRKYRVGAVLNLRAEGAEDAAAARAEGMRYLHLPIPDGAAPSPEQVAAFFRFLAQAHREHRVALWHCAGGIGRTGVLAAMQRLREGWGVQEAAQEMFEMGLSYPQAIAHLPALNAFAAALGQPTWYPADWPYGRRAPYDYRTIVRQLP
jgi:predicted protein tyrosine phosphatase